MGATQSKKSPFRARAMRKAATSRSLDAAQAAVRCFSSEEGTCSTSAGCSWAATLNYCTSASSALRVIDNLDKLCRTPLNTLQSQQLMFVLGGMLSLLGEDPHVLPTVQQRCDALRQRSHFIVARIRRVFKGWSTTSQILEALCVDCKSLCNRVGRGKLLHAIETCVAAAVLNHATDATVRRTLLKALQSMGLTKETCKGGIRLRHVLGLASLVTLGVVASRCMSSPSKASLRGTVTDSGALAHAVRTATEPPITTASPPLSSPHAVFVDIATRGVSATGTIAALPALPNNYVAVMDNKKPGLPRIGVFNVFDGTVQPLELDSQLASAKDLEAIVPVPKTPGNYFVLESKGSVYEVAVNASAGTVRAITKFALPKLAPYQNMEAMAVTPLDDGRLRLDYMQRGGQSKGLPAVVATTGAAVLTRGDGGTWGVEAIEGRGEVTPPADAVFMRAATDHSGKWMMSATDVEDLDDGLAEGAGLPSTHDTSLVWAVDGSSAPIVLNGGKAEGIWANGDAMDIVTDDEDRGTSLVRVVHGRVAGARLLTNRRELGLSGIAELHE